MLLILGLVSSYFLFQCFVKPKNSETIQNSDQEVVTFADNLFGGTGGVSIDPQGNIFVSDFGPTLNGIRGLNPKNRIFKLDPSGKIEAIHQFFQGASGSEFDHQGNLYQSNVAGGYVSKIGVNGTIDTIYADGMQSPVGIKADLLGNIFVANCGSQRILKVTASKDTSTFCKNSILNCPNGITLDDNGNFYVSNFMDGNIIKINSAGEASVFTTLPGNNNGHLIFHKNYLYVVARGAHQIYKVSLEGKTELFAGSGTRGRTNGKRLSSSFSFPNDLDISPNGKYIYVNEITDTISDHRVLTPTTVRRILLN